MNIHKNYTLISILVMTLLLLGLQMTLSETATLTLSHYSINTDSWSSQKNIRPIHNYSTITYDTVRTDNESKEPNPSPTVDPSTPPIIVSPGISLFLDSACTKPLTHLQWGSIYPGGSSTNVIYVKNTGSAALFLDLKTSNWNPSSTEGKLSISWDRNGYALSPGQSIESTLTLNVDPSTRDIDTFSVDITVSGHD